MSVNAKDDLNLNLSFASITNMFTRVYMMQSTTWKQKCQTCPFFQLLRIPYKPSFCGHWTPSCWQFKRIARSKFNKKCEPIFIFFKMHKGWPTYYMARCVYLSHAGLEVKGLQILLLEVSCPAGTASNTLRLK